MQNITFITQKNMKTVNHMASGN